MSGAEFRTHDDRLIVLPKLSVVAIQNCEKKPPPDAPDAKSYVLYVTPQGVKDVKLRAPFKQVLTQFPVSFGGVGWAHFTDTDGCDVAMPDKSIVGFEEQPDNKGFDCIFQLATGQMMLQIEAGADEIRAQLRPDDPPPPHHQGKPPEEDEPVGEEAAAPKAEATPAPKRKPGAKQP